MDDRFLFVVSSDGKVPTGRNHRRSIRRQAMSKVAVERRNENKQRNPNKRQLPIFLGATEESDQLARGCEEKMVTDSNSASLFLAKDQLSSTGYEVIRSEQDFDILSLSALTTFSVGRITAQVLARRPNLLPEVLRCRQWSYLDFVPSRLGHSEVLDSAVRCLIAKARHCLQSPGQPACKNVLRNYIKAIENLQLALNDARGRLEADVLCATQLLGIYELLDSTSDEPWKRHTAGASALIQLRGPTRYKTSFEQALLMSQMGPIFTEAIINSGLCFPRKTPWQELFGRISSNDEAFTDCSKLVVSLWATISAVPDLFADIQHAICTCRASASDNMELLMQRACHIRLDLWNWRQRYDATVSTNVNTLDKRYEVLGVCLANALVLDRLIVALHPGNGAEMEEEAQSLAHQLFKLADAAYQINPRAALFMEFKLIAARAALATKDEWQVSISSAQNNQSFQPVSKEVFERWCSFKGRKVDRRK